MLPEFNISIPALPNTFILEFMDIANFDLVDMGAVTEGVGLD